jgi:predicted secreted protein
MSDAIAGVGAQFKFGDGTSDEGFDALAEVNSITKSGMSREQIDVTSLDSTDGYREFIGGFRDGGEYVLNMNFTRDNYILLLGEFEDDDSRNIQVSFPDTGNTIEEVAGIVTDLGYAIVTDDKITLDVTIKVTGAPSVSS